MASDHTAKANDLMNQAHTDKAAAEADLAKSRNELNSGKQAQAQADMAAAQKLILKAQNEEHNAQIQRAKAKQDETLASRCAAMQKKAAPGISKSQVNRH